MPKIKFQEIQLETINMTIEAMPVENKIIKLDITKLLRGKGCEAKFVIKKQKDIFVGKLRSLKIHPSYIRRIIRNNTSIIEDSFECNAKDATLRIKPFIITRKKIHRSIRKRIRNEAKKEIAKFCEDKTKEEIFKAILSSLLQKELSRKLKKIYPLAFCDIRIIEAKK